MLIALSPTDLVTLSIAFLFLVYLRYTASKRQAFPLPPGPKKRILLGNLLDIPTSLGWLTYVRWAKEYNSDIIHLRAVGIDFIILDSFRAAADLLDKRSSNYSSRPQFPMVSDLMGWGWLFSAMVYGEPWKERRRLFQRYFHPSNSHLHAPTQLEHVRKMMPRLLDQPEEFFSITRHATGGMSMALAYGIPIHPTNDPHINLAQTALHGIVEAAAPGAFLVDVMPFLRYVPEWVPGAGFQKKAREWRKLQVDFREKPYAAGMAEINKGTAQSSFTSSSMENMDPGADQAQQIEAIKDTAGLVFAGGADTTLSGIFTFYLAMSCYPDFQNKARAELDSVLHGRLPEFGDEPQLPYVTAIVKEIIRWKPSTPIILPHSNIEADVYKGYHIPKGSLVIANAWAMCYNEDDYPDPETFNPERFLKNGQLNPDVRDPAAIVFGFGRRICPGAQIGMSTLWLMFATLLSTFEFSKPIDGDGNVIEPSMEYEDGLIWSVFAYTPEKTTSD